MAKLFRYFQDWKTEIFTCPVCGWRGTFEEGSVEIYEELMDSSCPDCEWFDAPMLAIVSWPTIQECEDNRDKMEAIDIMALDMRKDFLAKFESMRLKSPDELPDLAGSEITITWDIAGEEPGGYTVLIHEGKEIWREPAVYEGYERFGEVVDLLKEKYGSRLIDVEPTKRSELYLYGDCIGSMRAVKSRREGIQNADSE